MLNRLSYFFPIAKDITSTSKNMMIKEVIKAESHEVNVKIVHGFAKQRPDLKQFVLQMAVTGLQSSHFGTRH